VEWQILLTEEALRDLKRLDRVISKRIKKKLLLLRSDPKGFSKSLKGTKIGDYRMRVGDFRIVFETKGTIIYVLRVAHRSEVYKEK